jgi:dihydrofolate synthase/folylpolyglutamate synthase
LLLIEELLRAAPSFQVDKDFSPPSLSQPGACRLRYVTGFGAYDVRLSLRGGHQVLNALTALHLGEVLAAAGFAISPQAIVQGLQTAQWPGRLEWLSLGKAAPSLLLDGAHNPAGARVLRKFLDDFCSRRPVTILFGAMADKAFAEMMKIIFPAARQIIVAKIDAPRAAAADNLLACARQLGFQAQGAANVREALALAQRVTPPRGVICACGSLYLAGEIKRLLSGAQ